ncbi:MAG: hypothetical protein U1E33_01705 [Rhodospirillales bacterium]
MQPSAIAVHLPDRRCPHLVYEMEAIDPAGLFESATAGSTARLPGCLRRGRLLPEIIDPHPALPTATVSSTGGARLRQPHYEIFEARRPSQRVADIDGVSFAVWAPNAEASA